MPTGNTPTPDAYLVAMTAAIEAYQALKPRMRGWLHAGAVPAAVVAGLVLILLCTGRIAVGSDHLRREHGGAFRNQRDVPPRHLGTSDPWRPQTHGSRHYLHFHRRYVHAHRADCCRRHCRHCAAVDRLVSRVGRSDLPGVLGRCASLADCSVYISMGWAAVFFIPEILSNGGTAIFLLIAVGGLCYPLAQ